MKIAISFIKYAIALCVLCAVHFTSNAQTVLYVTQSGNGNMDGTSWANAYNGTQLQTAINQLAAGSGGQVWVGSGTYYPTQDDAGNTSPSDPRMMTFSLKSNVAIYGGFVGNETQLAGREPYYYNTTYLSGDIGVSGDNTDNSYNVVYSSNVDSTAILDGFYIENGNASGTTAIRSSNGGGFYLSGGKISNCDICYNTATSRGGGAYIVNSASFSTVYFYYDNAQFGAGAYITGGGKISNSTIYYNTATCTGGGLSIETSATITNCNITNNTSNGTSKQFTFSEGGGVDASAYEGTVILSGCTISSNTSSSSQGSAYGGGLYCTYGVTVSQCTINGNTCTNGQGGGICMSSSKLINCSISDNTGYYGGGVNSTGSSIIGCLINNNTATADGGGVYVGGNGTVITNATIANNLSNNAGQRIQLYVYSSAPGTCNVTNTVLTGAQYNGNPVLLTSVPTTFTVNLTDCASDGTQLYNIASAYFKSPTSFVGASANGTQLSQINSANWSLNGNSPLINAGTPDTTNLYIPTTDLSGSPRIAINRIDIGAYEFQSIRYVTVAGAGSKTGANWANAYAGDSLQYAINQGLGEVWVAAGTYKPKYAASGTIPSNARSKVFSIAKKAIVYGGFAGTETAPSQRLRTDLDGNGKVEKWEFVNQTILSGDIGTVGDSTDNCNSIVSFPAGIDTSSVDGVTITSSMGGAAVTFVDGLSHSRLVNCVVTRSNNGGVTLQGLANISNCLISKNTSGVFLNGGGTIDSSKVDGNIGGTNGNGLYFNNGGIATNTIISNNNGYCGGGVYISTMGTLDKCIITGNKASATSGTPQGGGIIILGNGIVANSFITNNYSSEFSGGIAINNAGTIVNSVIANNSSPYYSGISMGGQGGQLINCTVANNGGADLYLNGSSNTSNLINTVITGYNTISGSALAVQNCAIYGGYSGSGASSIINVSDISDVQFTRPTSFSGNASTAAQVAEIQNADWSITAVSPLVNAGTTTGTYLQGLSAGSALYDSCVYADITGKPRPAFSADDIGAYELQSIAIPTPVSSITVQNTGVGTASISWGSAAGSGYLALVKEGSTGLPTPVVGQSYAGNTVFTKGATPDGSWYSVYDGTTTAVNVSNLTPGTWYRIAIDAYNGMNYKVYSPAVDGQNVVKFYAKQPQDITFDAPNEIDGQSSFIPNALASSNLQVSFTSSDNTIALPYGNAIQILKPGTVTITASQSGNDQFFAATPVSKTIVFGKATQSISFSMDTVATYGDADISLNATSTSGLPVQFTSSNNNIATVSNGWLSFRNAGSVTITATQPGNNYFAPAQSVVYTQIVKKTSQTITFNALSTKTYGDASFELPATASSGLAVSYISSNNSVISIAGNIATIISGGTATISAYQSGNNDYFGSDTISQTIRINKAMQTIGFPEIPIKKVGMIPFRLFAVSSSGYPIVYTSSNPAVADVVENEVTINGPGSCEIIASISESANYFGTSDTNTLIVTALNDLIMPEYTLTRDSTINLQSLILNTNNETFAFVAGKHASATVSGDLATILVKKDSTTCWTGTDTLWFRATNNTVVGDTQTFGIKVRCIPLVEQIGLVTVDSTTGTKCIIAWERSKNAQIASYVIYRGGNAAGQWDSIGTVKANERSLFVDNDVNVNQQAYQYTMVTVDACGNHSAKSSIQTTMHLMTGVNLQNQPQLWWTPYGGADVNSYVVYRKDQTTGKLDSIGSSILTSFTDLYAPTGSVDYRVAIRFTNAINPDLLKSDTGPFSQSLSNMAESQLTVVAKTDLDAAITVYPNPASSYFVVNAKENAQVQVYTVGGTLVLSTTIKNNEPIATDGVPAGLYVVKIITAQQVVTRSLVVE